MTENMIDRVAKALFEHHYKDDYARYNSAKILFGTERPTWEMITGPDFVPQLAETWRAQGRVAIAAMHKPTAEIIIIGYSTDAIELWQRMIDAVLAPLQSDKT